MASRFLMALVLVGGIALQQRADAEVPERWVETPLGLAFGAPPTIGDPMLSPDGTRLLFIQQTRAGVSLLQSMNLASAEVSTLIQGDEDGFDLNHCDFASEERVFCMLQSRDPDEAAGDRELVAVNLDGSDLLEVEISASCLQYDKLRGQIRFDRMADDSQRILLVCGDSTRVLDIFSGEMAEMADTGEGGQQIYTNGHGLANLYVAKDGNRERWFVRDDATDDWRPLLQTDPMAFETPLRPVGYGTSLDRLFNIGWDADSQTWALYRLNLANGNNQLVFAHGAADVQLVDTMGRNKRVVAAAFVDGRSQRAIVDRRVAEVFQYLTELMPDGEIEILDESWDRSLYLARVRSPNIASALLLVNMDDQAVQSIGPEYDHLSDFILAEPTLFQLDSSTGGPLTLQLTRPFDVEGAVPAVIVPRSEASHADIVDPDYLVQFLAANGYAVLQVQNRVEPEYGTGWLPERAVAGWNRTADDIRDAADFLVSQGFSEEGMICAAGKDYGAYAALMAAIKYPDSISCVVGISSVADPELTMAGDLALAANGADWLDDASPVVRAEELDAPTILFHGGSDTELSLDGHADELYDALDDARKEVEFIEYPNATHEFARAPYRVDMLARTRAFLAEWVGPALQDDESIDQGFIYRPELGGGD